MLHINAEEISHVPAVGSNNADNTFDSPLVVSNRDGSTLERLEWVIASLVTMATNIANWASSFLTLTETGGTITTDGSEQNIYINNAPAGIYDPKIIQLDFTNQTATETIIIREYYRIKTGGNLIQIDKKTFVGVQNPLLKNIKLEENRFGVKVTIEKTAGTNRAYDYEAVYKI